MQLSSKSYTEIKFCRTCKSDLLEVVVKLGDQALTGVFPKSSTALLTTGPLSLVLCKECGLLQLQHSYSLEEMYGDNYGYRSGLNSSMVCHLQNKVKKIQSSLSLSLSLSFSLNKILYLI